MKGSIRQRSPGSWELTIDMGRDALGKRCRKHVTVRGAKFTAQREIRCPLWRFCEVVFTRDPPKSRITGC